MKKESGNNSEKMRLTKIYGIFDLKKRKLVDVELKFKDIEFIYDVSEYNGNRYKIMQFEIDIDID
jgi:hypothetical protein